MIKQMAAIACSALLLAGCSVQQLQWVPQAPTASAEVQEQQAQRVLYVQDDQGLLEGALQAYSQATGVQVVSQQNQPDAAPGLVVTYQLPTSQTAVDLAQEVPLLMTSAGRSAQNSCYGLPFGGGSYGYLADARMLRALLGSSFDPAQLAAASWEEWQTFVQTVQAWIEQPQAVSVVLAGRSYRLPAQPGPELGQLAGVFTFAGSTAYNGAVLTPVLATCFATPEQVASRTQEDTAALQKNLTALVELMKLEASAMAGPQGRLQSSQALELSQEQALQTFAQGQALFYRTGTSEIKLMEPQLAQEVCLVPVPFGFAAESLSGEGFAMDQLRWPIEAAEGWLMVSSQAESQQQKEAQAFLLWAYTNPAAASQLPAATTTQEGHLPDLAAALSDYVRSDLQNQAAVLLGAE